MLRNNETTHRTSIGGNSSDDKQENESDHELGCKSLANANRRDSDPTREERVIHILECIAGTDGGRDLCGNVGGDMCPWEMAKGRKGNGEGWVEMCT